MSVSRRKKPRWPEDDRCCTLQKNHPLCNTFQDLHRRQWRQREEPLAPNLAKALIKAVTSGEPELTEKVASYHTSIKAIITRAMCGPDVSPNEEQDTAAYLLQQVWFASLVGWMGGLHGQAAVMEHVNSAVKLLLLGIDAAGASD